VLSQYFDKAFVCCAIDGALLQENGQRAIIAGFN
jgi:hypothetical protein